MFTNLQNLYLSLVASVEEKQDILVQNLFTNIAKASDIPFDSLTIAIYKIDFLYIIATDIYKAILEAGNTAPSQDKISIAILKAAWPLIKTYILILF